MFAATTLLIFQGTVKVYRWPPPEGSVYLTESGLNVGDEGLLQDMPSNSPIDIAIRVYVLRAIGLCSQDLNGKSDPYLMVKLGSCTLTDKDNYVCQQLDPVFGRLEFDYQFCRHGKTILMHDAQGCPNDAAYLPSCLIPLLRDSAHIRPL
jgi:hypothetical protein